MQVTNNNYQPNFGAIIPTDAAKKAIRNRLSAKKAEALLAELPNMCPDFRVDLSTTSFECNRLDVMIRDAAGRFRRYDEESILSSIFRSPKRYIEKVVKIINEEIKNPVIEK